VMGRGWCFLARRPLGLAAKCSAHPTCSTTDLLPPGVQLARDSTPRDILQPGQQAFGGFPPEPENCLARLPIFFVLATLLLGKAPHPSDAAQ